MTSVAPQMLLLIAMLAAGAVQAQTLPSPKNIRPAPVQPLPYSHKQHLSNGLECKDCHEFPGPGDVATLPPTQKCMSCHSTIKKDSPTIQQLADYHKRGEAVPWKPVYYLPDFVLFNHEVHLNKAKATCEACHGPVRERDVMRREKDISMAGCMECHRQTTASISCDFCHDPR